MAESLLVSIASTAEGAGDCGELGVIFFMSELLAGFEKFNLQAVNRGLVGYCVSWFVHKLISSMSGFVDQII